MTNFIPVFPIEVVVYPNESYRLHISNDNYKHLITDCYGENKPFGIVPIINNRLSETGTLVDIVEVAEVWEDGRMNVVVKGSTVFKVLELIKSIPEKLYSGAIVSYLDNMTVSSPSIAQKVTGLLRQFHHLINYLPTTNKDDDQITSYDMAHTAGLSLQEELELLELLFESQRLEYLRRHLIKTIPVLANIQSMLKRSAKTNDFKNHKGFDFEANQ
ncbi:MAG: peptidase S16 [Pseudopedobacter saltans]|uniref:Peptidase S16 n=1 Tax=Pseudopedobacter saltans TaxID=151895 RepID=A0A2W5F6M0_9SPHI|nr:MAG: peptidase S16 [Pseudopedobacter saltans]